LSKLLFCLSFVLLPQAPAWAQGPREPFEIALKHPGDKSESLARDQLRKRIKN